MIRFETFLRKVKHLKFLKQRFDGVNDGLTALFCNTAENDKIYVHLFDEVFDITVNELVKDIEDSLGIDGTKNDMVQHSIDYLVYDSEFGTQRQFWIDTKETGYDYTIWNAYCDLTGVLTKDICDSFENPKFIV